MKIRSILRYTSFRANRQLRCGVNPLGFESRLRNAGNAETAGINRSIRLESRCRKMIDAPENSSRRSEVMVMQTA